MNKLVACGTSITIYIKKLDLSIFLSPVRYGCYKLEVCAISSLLFTKSSTFERSAFQ